MKTVLSFGMGVESSSLLVYWTENSSRLDFDLTEDLIVVTAMTGGEYIDTKIQVEKLRLFGNCCESPQHLVVNSISRRNHGFNGLRRIRTDQSVKIRFDPSNPWFLLLFLNRKMLGCLTAIPKEPKLILPRMRAHDIRYVQVARAGHLESDGIVVLDDTREPRTVYLDGAYKLSDELRAAGTLPQYAGAHRCSIKFKAWTIQKWIAQELAGEPYRHAIGYNAEEQRRIEKSDLAFAEREPVRVAFGFNANEGERIGKARAYDTPLRRGWYPLAEELGWDRDACQRYLKEITGETFLRSACTFCPFNNLKEDGIARLRRHPEKVAEALLLEYQSLCLNPRGTLYRNRTLLSIIVANHHAETLRHFRMRLEEAEYALYRVRRIYNAPGRADRAVERLETGSRGEMNNRFERISSSLGVRVEHDIRYGYVREREPDCYPAVEEFFVVAPAAIESKTRYGFDWFEAKWREALGETGQDRLFD